MPADLGSTPYTDYTREWVQVLPLLRSSWSSGPKFHNTEPSCRSRSSRHAYYVKNPLQQPFLQCQIFASPMLSELLGLLDLTFSCGGNTIVGPIPFSIGGIGIANTISLAGLTKGWNSIRIVTLSTINSKEVNAPLSVHDSSKRWPRSRDAMKRRSTQSRQNPCLEGGQPRTPRHLSICPTPEKS